MATRKCRNSQDSFCYVCGYYVSSKRVSRHIEKGTKYWMAYSLYFGMPIGDQDEAWAPHVICGSCQVTLEGWLRGSRKSMPFAIARVWREPKNHLDDCYFCSVDITKYRKAKGRLALNYPSMPSSIAPVPHSHDLPGPLPPAQIVFIVNGGLTTGADNISIMELFVASGFQDIEEVIMVPGKQYSFVILNDPNLAKDAVNSMSGIKCLPQTKNPLYMTCINKIPTIITTVKHDMPPGLILIEDFISSEEEIILSNLINWDENPSQPSEGSLLKHRQVRHFGYEFKYSSNSIDKSCPLEHDLPDQVLPICQRLVDKNLMLEFPDQLTVNRYLPGQGIPPHVDTHSSFTGEIASLSILGGVSMDFRCNREYADEGKRTSDANHHNSVYLPAKSICVMTGPARFSWTHGICPRKTDIVASPGDAQKRLILKQRSQRVSFTFRKVRKGECDCGFPRRCDSREHKDASRTLPIQTTSPSELEQEHVLNVYEKIADHFSHTRHKPWPRVLEFVKSLSAGSLLLDVGCGNGKYLGHNQDIFQLGTDTSQNLVNICASKSEAALGNCLRLPFRSTSFDALLCIAVIHHLASQERRRMAVSELVRVLSLGGVGLIYVWAMDQRKGKMSTYLKQKRSNRAGERPDQPCGESQSGGGESNSEEKEWRSLHVHQNRTDFVEQDLFVPWKIKPTQFRKEQTPPLNGSDPVYHRYYHVFKEGELEELLRSFPAVEILEFLR